MYLQSAKTVDMIHLVCMKCVDSQSSILFEEQSGEIFTRCSLELVWSERGGPSISRLWSLLLRANKELRNPDGSGSVNWLVLAEAQGRNCMTLE
ncbi:hypothetical protein AVEN_118831-1 [Araneus ventricosus]|uniref:Uncharacterized protein n=1 Tax=Araneus ventricosus TaxID=182803 RepID=A0A4Y2V9Y8_ARAVE|nr:hypothetical protein AVEN_118831-1 [Araneus ventricosus]